MAEMGFSRGRIDQAHQGSVSIRILPVYRNIVLTNEPDVLFLKNKQVMMQGSILLIQPMFVNSVFFFFFLFNF